jgi:hypothetical protein
MKTPNTASRTSTMIDWTRSMNFAPAMFTTATSNTTAVVSRWLHSGAASSPKNSAEP